MAEKERQISRTELAFAVDRQFKDYLLGVSPGEAVDVLSVIAGTRKDNKAQSIQLVLRINDLIPPSVLTRSGPGHFYRIGRRTDRLIIYLSLSTAHFPKRYRYASLLGVLGKYAKEAGAFCQLTSDEGEWEVMFWWL